MLRTAEPHPCCRRRFIPLVIVTMLAETSVANGGTIVADFEGNLVGNFVTQYEEAGMVFTSDGGAGLSFLINIITLDIGLFEATANGLFGVNATMPSPAESVTVSFYLAQDDVVTLTAFDERGFLLDSVSASGPPTSNEYLFLTVTAPDHAISSIHWIGSSETILVAGEVSANVVPAPGALALMLLGASGRIQRRRRSDTLDR